MSALAILVFWLATPRGCHKRTAVSVLVASIVLTALSAVRAAEPTPLGKTTQAQRLKGEFILSRNYYQNPVCQRFTQNLNQFRGLDFKTCNPRLSKKFPEFSRPKWEEIPFDLELAEQLFKSVYRLRASPSQAAVAEKHWQAWLEGSAAIRQAGGARMWRTRIDFDGDGREETIIRMLPPYGIPVQMPDELPWACDYNQGSLHMTDNIHPEVSDQFSYGAGSDIVYFAGDHRYYQVLWNPYGPAYGDIDIGATAGVVLSRLNWNGYLVTGGDDCLIDWVPTGKYKPLNHRR